MDRRLQFLINIIVALVISVAFVGIYFYVSTNDELLEQVWSKCNLEHIKTHIGI